MSASLVGSEMCIRDSLGQITHDPTPLLLRSGLRVIRGAEEQEGCIRDGGCLLYTSDAADDM
eukprot:14192698-Alexandrium_andersonii.AAC.1